MCWLKAIAGAWCTTTRMHESVIWPCVFGCKDCPDSLTHYLVCPILWQFPREFMSLEDPGLSIGSRLCLSNPSTDKLTSLAFVHTLYHWIKKDPCCVKHNGLIQSPCIVQQRATELSRAIIHLVSDHCETQEHVQIDPIG